jgi:hypothetical protein
MQCSSIDWRPLVWLYYSSQSLDLIGALRKVLHTTISMVLCVIGDSPYRSQLWAVWSQHGADGYLGSAYGG